MHKNKVSTFKNRISNVLHNLVKHNFNLHSQEHPQEQLQNANISEPLMKKSVADARTLVLKFGTNAITTDNRVDEGKLDQIAAEVKLLKLAKKDVVIVSSGAVACGMELNKLQIRPAEIEELQLLSAEGQPLLMHKYRIAFSKYSLGVLQVLTTHHHFSTYQERENAINGLRLAFAKKNKIPIFNINDFFTKEELMPKFKDHTFTDNDPLAALVTKYLKADALVILSNAGKLGSGGETSKKKAIDTATTSGAIVAICKFEDLHSALIGENIGNIYSPRNIPAW
jgi:glutamate 5-kinase